MTEPATCRAEISRRTVKPSRAPMNISCASMVATGPNVRRSIWYALRCSGSSTAARMSAMLSRTRDGTVISPSPGSSITMMPMRANTSMKVAANAGRNEISIRMRGPHPAAMRAASLTMWACRWSAMNGSAISMATKIARILGTKASVISWIWVSAWNSEMMTPTTSPISSSGLETITSVRIASRATSSTSDPVIAPIPLSSPSLQQIPWSTGSPRARGRQKGSAGQDLACCVRPSDRHPHDFFVGLDHPIAHRDQSLDRHLGFRHRGHHVDDIGLAGHHGTLLGIGRLAGLEHAADGVLEQRTEAWALCFADGLAEPPGCIGDAGETGIGIGGG